MIIAKRKQLIINKINNFSQSDLVKLNNIYCKEKGYNFAMVYKNGEEFFNMFFEGELFKAIRAAYFGEYNPTHSWVKFIGSGDLGSIARFTTEDLVELVGVIADFILENEIPFNDLLKLK